MCLAMPAAACTLSAKSVQRRHVMRFKNSLQPKQPPSHPKQPKQPPTHPNKEYVEGNYIAFFPAHSGSNCGIDSMGNRHHARPSRTSCTCVWVYSVLEVAYNGRAQPEQPLLRHGEVLHGRVFYHAIACCTCQCAVCWSIGL